MRRWIHIAFLAASFALLRWLSGWWAVLLPAAALAVMLHYRRRASITMPLWEVDLDGSYQYFVFAKTAQRALDELARLHLDGENWGIDWVKWARKEHGVEEIDVLRVNDDKRFPVHLEDPMHSPGQPTLPSGRVEMLVRQWAKYYPNGGLLSEVDW